MLELFICVPLSPGCESLGTDSSCPCCPPSAFVVQRDLEDVQMGECVCVCARAPGWDLIEGVGQGHVLFECGIYASRMGVSLGVHDLRGNLCHTGPQVFWTKCKRAAHAPVYGTVMKIVEALMTQCGEVSC